VTPDERERMTALCKRIAQEKDHQKFTELLQALNELLDGKEQRLQVDAVKQNAPSCGPTTRP
jgi:hypothetical protein